MDGRLQLAHFLEADLKPWAAALAASLFSGPAVPSAGEQPGVLVQGCTAAAFAAAASSNVVHWERAWRHLDELAPLGDAVATVLRAWRLPLLEQLPRAPAEWQPAVIGSHAVDGALTVSFDTAAACRGVLHAVHDVHSITLVPPAAPQQFELALHALASMPALRSLSWFWDADSSFKTSLRDECAVAEHLTRLSQLERLCITDDDAAVLTQPLGTLTALTALAVALRNVGAGVAALAPALSRLSRLAILGLEGNRVDAARAAALAPPCSTLTALTALVLKECYINAAGAEVLMPALSHLSRLADLRLDCNWNFGAAGAAALAQPLGTLTALTVLDLSRSDIGAPGAESLAPALSRLTRLANLGLRHNRLGAAGAAALA